MKSTKVLSHTERVSYILRSLALRIDPRSGHLIKLAEAVGVHAVTISDWISQGYVPVESVERLQKCFGKELVKLDDLCAPEFRR